MLSSIIDGNSLNIIHNKLGLYKSTIYYHYKKIRGKRFQVPNFVIMESEIEGEILGAFAADGSCFIVPNGQYTICFYIGGSEMDYSMQLSNLLEDYFHKKPYVYKSLKKNVILIRYRSKAIYNFIKNYLEWEGKKVYSIKLKTIELNQNFLRGFIRGYFDCDGHSDKEYCRATMMGVSGKMLAQIYSIIKKLGFTPEYSIYIEKRTNMKNLHKVIFKGDEAKRFIQFIRPRNLLRIRRWGCHDLNSR